MRSLNERIRPPSMRKAKASRQAAGAASTKASSSALAEGAMRERRVQSSQVRTFGTMTTDLLALSDWLEAEGVERIFTPGATTTEIVEWLRGRLERAPTG